MVTVHVWDNHRGTGHASMQIGDQYVSFHASPEVPSSRVLSGDSVEPEYAEAYEEDKARFHDTLVESVKLRGLEGRGGLDERAMLGYCASHRPERYRLYFKNCSTLCTKLLHVGAAGSTEPGLLSDVARRVRLAYEELSSAFSGGRGGWVSGLSVDNVVSTFETIAARMKTPHRRTTAEVELNAIILAGGILLRQFVCTPGQVLTYAKILSKSGFKA